MPDVDALISQVQRYHCLSDFRLLYSDELERDLNEADHKGFDFIGTVKTAGSGTTFVFKDRKFH